MRRSDLNDDTILSLLEELANNLGIQIRYEHLKKEGSFYPGGLCRIKGENIIIINSKAKADDKIQILARGMKSFDLSQVFIKPALREFLAIDTE
jgi:hypothetical protein